MRSQFIDLRLREFLLNNKIQKWPLDCVVILRQLKKSGRYGIQNINVLKNMPAEFDAATEYHSNTKLYTMWFNGQKLHYPFQKSSDRRLNFTIAHEIGHIVLEHLLLPSSSKTTAEIYMEDMEADEFAARLLMPEELLCSFNYYSLDSAALWLNVSNSALAVRLYRLKRIDLIKSRRVNSCIRCGNIRFSSLSAYCGVCGLPRSKGQWGIRRIYYPDEIRMDSYKRSISCPNCHNKISKLTGDNCPYCKTSIFNLCSGGNDCLHANPGFARFCEICGKPTCYYKRGFFSDWQDLYTSPFEAPYKLLSCSS